jgi:hypothetical protein
MVQQALVAFAVLLQRLFAIAKINQNIRGGFIFEPAMNAEMLLPVQDNLLVDAIEKTFSIGQVINSIQDIGFSRTIGACNTINVFAKLQMLLLVILEEKQLNFGEVHGANLGT